MATLLAFLTLSVGASGHGLHGEELRDYKVAAAASVIGQTHLPVKYRTSTTRNMSSWKNEVESVVVMLSHASAARATI